MFFIESIMSASQGLPGKGFLADMNASFSPGTTFHSSSPFDGPPAIFMFVFVLIAVVIVGGIIFSVGKGVSEWADNNQQPVLTVPAKVVAKRTTLAVTSNFVGAGSNPTYNHGTRSSTSYFVTFEFSSGDRKEFNLSAHQYGLLAESDRGELTFQGTRFNGFQRHSNSSETTTSEPPLECAPVVTAAQNASLPNANNFCPFCGWAVNGDFKFCPQCGKNQPVYTSQT
jgi:hypothetical protein